MAEPESLNTMAQNSYTRLSDGSYAIKTSSVASSSGSVLSTSGPNSESGFAAGSVTAPAADTVIAQYQPPSGDAGKLYRIEITVWLSGTAPASVDNFNLAFKSGSTVVSKIPVIPDIHIPVTFEFYFKATSGTPFTVSSVDAGTTGVVYNVFISATRVVS